MNRALFCRQSEVQAFATYVAAHPGCTGAEACKALGIQGQPTSFAYQARQMGLIAPSDPARYGRLYPMEK